MPIQRIPEDAERGVTPRQPDDLQVGQGDVYLLAIGIDAYQHFRPLHNAVKDVQDFAGLMIRDYGFRNEAPYTRLLLNEEATRANIIRALIDLSRRVQKDDRVLLYYSGHGHLDSHTKLGYWIPVEAEPENEAGFISNSDVRDYIKAMKSRHILLISDSCFSSALLVRGATRDVGGAFEDWENKRSRWLFCSGRGVVSDGEPGQNSPFSAQILRVLADRQRDKINIARLADEVITAVRFNYEQQAEACPLFGADHDGGQFIFYRPLTAEQKEELAFKAVMADRDKTGLIYFLETAKSSEHRQAARQLLHEIEDDESWKKVNKNSYAALDEFLEHNPDNRHADEARERMRQFRKKQEQDKLQTAREPKAEKARETETLKARSVRPWQRYLALVLVIAVLSWLFWSIYRRSEAPGDLGQSKTAEKKENPAGTVIDTPSAPINSPAAGKSSPVQVQPDKKNTSDATAEKLPRPTPKFTFDYPMKRVQGGTFTMGNNDYYNACLHDVTVSSFEIGLYEVTQDQWRSVMGNNPSHHIGCGDCPVENVSWDDVQQFIKKLNQLTGQNYDLPTEAEWEFAARGGNASRGYRYAGSNELDDVAWHRGNSGGKTHPVGSKKVPNELGLFDMSGNVWEWCKDQDGPYPGCSEPKGRTGFRVLRGGSWGLSYVTYFRPAVRYGDVPNIRDVSFGFRVARH